MVVKNEDRFIWYALASVLPFAHQILVTDTGSTDRTISCIESFHDDSIVLTRKQIRQAADIGAIRQEQIDKTRTDWLWIVDGDEIYPRAVGEEIRTLTSQRNDGEGIVVGRYDLLGDIYHYQSENVGAYNLFGRRGHVVLRLINKKQIPGLHVAGTYPYEGYYDQHDVELIHHDPRLFAFTTGRIAHAMYLRRSSNGAQLRDTFHRKKWKIEHGRTVPFADIPEVFHRQVPAGIPNVTEGASFMYRVGASLLTPMKKIKRRFLSVL